MKYRLVLLACCALGAAASPALAFKTIEGCDIVALASQAQSSGIAPEHWQSYHDKVETILGAAPKGEASLADWRAVAGELIKAQTELLEPVRASQAYQDYLSGDKCLVLSKLNAGAVETLLEEAGQSTPAPAMTALRQVTQAARTTMDRIERSARFRSKRDKTFMAAQYYCFVAASIQALLPLERQQTIGLGAFGETIGCKEAGRP
ncbi:MAG: hypothetical protein ACXWVI_09400 [Methyloceanibacter sp.]